ncbi:serine hydrolase domain-containing protein [Lapidilactobacillus luobeiensis]|uniref:serine hydrolase domain-containing protein n=1 Tax=Lapidilactobacillus luobeiensis TaxID=2950371 RepID=UPI0021C29E7C|nr:serine hydrolase domain-containing protein [Lapidilactobacillus luobeiensis]
MMKKRKKASVGKALLVLGTTLLCLFAGYWGYCRYQAHIRVSYAAKVAQKKKKIKAETALRARHENLTHKQANEVTEVKLNSYFQSELAAQLQQIHFVGSALLAQHGAIVATYSAGYADYALQQRNNDQTAFEIDSLQKSLTGTMIMQEVEQGRIRLDDKLSRYYPQVTHSDQITLRQMLAMRSGLTMTGMGKEAYTSDDAVIAYDIDHLSFSATFYGREDYQPVNFVLLAGILTQVTGKTYRTLFKERFIDALDLQQTAFGYDFSPAFKAATAYPITDALLGSYNNPMTLNATQQHLELGTGQLFMSASDFYQAVRSIFDGTLISAKSVQELYVPGSNSPYSGGFYNGPEVRYANGLGAGYESTVYLSNDGQNAVVLMSNYGVNFLSLKNKAAMLINLVK